ncbi:hypothetical protein [Kribbella sp. HUAS MG21]|uniref:Uncharacterized protein n=1 Tax=Kribbella sp. HUAS MG21 TaxID=3160966 RepID=A0AAU7TNQ9_9ACTN
MMRVMLEDGDYYDVPADLMTFDDGAVVFWNAGDEVGRHRQSRIRSLEVLDTRSMTRRIQRARKTHPNAFRPWSVDDEQTLIELHTQGATIDQLIKALGRREGGILTRLRALGLLTEEDHPTPTPTAAPASAPTPAAPKP